MLGKRAVKDPKWREEFLGKLFTTRDQIKAAFDAVDFESERVSFEVQNKSSHVMEVVSGGSRLGVSRG